MTVTGSLPLTQLPDVALVECLRAGAVDPAAFGAEVQRRVKAETAERARRVREVAWQEAMQAQFEAAEVYCHGNMLSAAGERARVNPYNGEREPIEPEHLWRVSEREAERWASEELRNYWLDDPRLTYGAWCRQGSAAAEARRARDERDLSAMRTGHQGAGQSHQAVGQTGRVTVTPMTEAQKARYMAALSAYGSRAASLTPAPQPGTIARFTARLNQLTDELTRDAARLRKATQSHQ